MAVGAWERFAWSASRSSLLCLVTFTRRGARFRVVDSEVIAAVSSGGWLSAAVGVRVRV